MKPNYTLLKIDGSLRTAVEACKALKLNVDELTVRESLILLAIRFVRFLFLQVFKLPPERD